MRLAGESAARDYSRPAGLRPLVSREARPEGDAVREARPNGDAEGKTVRFFWPADSFTGFGRDPFAPPRLIPQTTRVDGGRKSALKAGLRAACPKRPGVYGMLDAAGQLIYVGKSKQLRTRLLSYFSPKNAREKPGKILRDTTTLIWEPQPSEFAALLRELYLIRTWRPRWNVKDQPKSRRACYLCIGRPPARLVFVTASPPKDAVTFGPFQGRRRLQAAADVLNQHFRLRDCSSQVPFWFSDQQDLFPEPRRPGCLRLELGTCLGPCAGGCTSTAYAAAVRQAQAFLEGHDDAPLTELRNRMTAAAAAQRFEMAARLRDRLEVAESLAARLARLRTVRETFNFIYPVTGIDGRTLWYVIAAGCVAAAVRPPTNARRSAIAAELLRSWQRNGRLEGYPITEQHPTIGLLSHWFRTRSGEIDRVLSIEDALALCRLHDRSDAPQRVATQSVATV